MVFNLEIWKEKTYTSLKNIGRWLEERKNKESPLLLYGYLSSLSLAPLVMAASSGDPMPVFMALGGVFGGVGGNLLANKVQEWANQAQRLDQAELSRLVVEQLSQNEALRAEIDQVLQKLEVIPQAQLNLDQAQQAWFVQTLKTELVQLGNLARFEANLSGVGAIAQGTGTTAVTATDGGKAIGVVQGNVVEQNYGTYIEEVQLDPKQARLPHLEQRYLKALHHRCNALPLAALGGEQQSGSEIRLNDVYINLNTDRRVPLSTPEKEKARGQEERPLSALEAATQTKLVVLLGDPGSGKSTFVQQLAAWLALAQLGDQEAMARLQGWEHLYWPLLLPLREVAARLGELDLSGLSAADRANRLVETVYSQWQAHLRTLRVAELADNLEDILAQKPILLIFDGLDEVARQFRPVIRQAVQAVLQAYPTIERVIITCRTRSYSGVTILPGFTAYTLEGFNSEQIRAFVTAWYIAQGRINGFSPEAIGQRTQDLRQAVLSKSLRSLASNPLLLTTMAIIHLQKVSLPREQVRLYSQAVQILLDGWQKYKGITVSERLQDVLSDSTKMRLMMQRLAYELHDRQSREGPEANLNRYDILKLLESPAYLNDITLGNELLAYIDQRAGLLVGLGGDEAGTQPQAYNFPHRAFQEYLAGCYMVTGRERELIQEYRRRAQEGDYWYLAGQLGAEALLYSDRPDTERLLDLAYALCPVGLPQAEGGWRTVHWSGQMAALLGRQTIQDDLDSVHAGGQAYLERLRSHLAQILAEHKLSALERAEAGQALAKLDDPRPGIGLRPDDLPDIVWCEVPAGPFLMGSDPTKDELADDDEQPQHQVELPAFRISRYPITQAQYRSFVEAGGYREAAYWPEAAAAGYWHEGRVKRIIFDGSNFIGEWATAPFDYGLPYNLDNQPVVGINWYEALAFCKWLTVRFKETGQTGPHELVALPSESQWEKAARGTEGQLYPWGDEANPTLANYSDAGIGAPSVVGCFPGGASPYGCEDMAGNVWEWTRSLWGEDWQKPDFGYPYDPLDGRENLEAGRNVLRVVRGGACYSGEQAVRCAFRLRINPNYWLDNQGFRVVVSPILTLASEPSDL